MILEQTTYGNSFMWAFKQLSLNTERDLRKASLMGKKISRKESEINKLGTKLSTVNVILYWSLLLDEMSSRLIKKLKLLTGFVS